jgi:hypothetical protein
MDNDTKQLLVENLDIAKENNLMLKKLVRAQKWAVIYRVVYWSIIILSSLGAYYFIQPFLSNLVNVYTGGVSGVTNFGDISKTIRDENQIKDLINSIK